MPDPALTGVPASPGRAGGPVFVVEEQPQALAFVEAATPEAAAAAAEQVAQQLEGLAAARRQGAPEAAAVLEAQALIARDPALGSAIDDALASGTPVAEAVVAAAEGFAAQLEESGDEYLAARAADVREVGRLLVAGLAGQPTSRLAGLERPSVVVAGELTPADTLGVEEGRILAFVTEAGGVTSHVAIVARELGIPAVVGVAGAVGAARRSGAAGAQVDGETGTVAWLGPEELAGAATAGKASAALDLDAAPVPVMANAGSVAAVRAAAALGLRGIGLFRTEFLFLSRPVAPSEEEQAHAYAAACEAMGAHPVIVRTLDAGSDKRLPYAPAPPEPNPALGRRGVRLWLASPDLRDAQVRALVRAGAGHRNLWVMVPMVASREEMEQSRRSFEEEAGRAGAPLPPLGMMVELPAVAVALEGFRGLVEFVSVGTNDLAQYALGADRELEWPEHLSELNPGCLRLVAEAVRGAHGLGIKAGVCGELAGRPEGAVFLAGVGADSLSLTAGSAGTVLKALRLAGPEACRRAAEGALEAADAGQARSLLREAAGLSP
jgi:phosphoenolpyruvate-protein phosphotransferase (PTS system enzyme I)